MSQYINLHKRDVSLKNEDLSLLNHPHIARMTFFCGSYNNFIQQVYIKFIKTDIKDIYNVTKDFYSTFLINVNES